MVSNLFMTFAWYGHLKYKSEALWIVVLTSWGLAFFEYWFAVPANRWGSSVYSAAELKTIQEVITLLVFAVFSVLYLKQPFTWNYAVGFVFIGVGAWFIFRGPINGRSEEQPPELQPLMRISYAVLCLQKK